MEEDISKLSLIAPLFYIPEEVLPFSYREGDGEKLFCFSLHKKEYRNFDPDRENLLGDLIFGGSAADGRDFNRNKLRELPRGDYFFTQKRELLSREDIIALIVEIQQETLWQRHMPGEKIYIRYLFEDGKTVTQIFRPFSDEL